IMAAYGIDAKDQTEADALREKLFAALRDEPVDKARDVMRRLLTEYGDAHALPRAAIEAQLSAMDTDWFRLFVTYDPAEALRHVTCPVLALAGSKDLQVPAAENLGAINTALSNDKEVTIAELPGLNHLFQEARTGSPLEYAAIQQTMSPAVLSLISSWI